MIDLYKLRLDGWMSYGKATFVLNNKGLTRIAGDIGTGKSAIMEAIFYLLFGKTLRGKDSVNDLINKVSDNGYLISLHFAIDDVPHYIKEIRGRPKRGLYFKINGVDKRGKGDPETRQNILKVVGMPANDFRSISFLGQRQKQLLVDGQPAERAKAIIDIFGLLRYTELIADCDADLKDAITEKKELTATLEHCTQELTKLEDTLLDDDADEIDPDALNIIETKITKVVNKVSAIRKLAKEIQDTITRVSTIAEQRKRVNSLKNEVRQLKQQLKEYPKINTDLSDLEDLIEDLQEEQAATSHKIKEAKREIANAKAMTNTCPVMVAECPVNIPVKYSKQVIQKFTSRKGAAEKEHAITDREISKVRKQQKTVRNRERITSAIDTKEDVIKKIAISNIDQIDIRAAKEKLKKYESGIDAGDSRVSELITERTDIRAAIAVQHERTTLREKVNEALAEKDAAVINLQKQVSDKSVEVQYLSAALAIFKKMKLYKIDLVLELLNSHLKVILAQISDGEYKAKFVSQRTTSDKKKKLDKIGIIVYDSYKALPIELCSGGQATEVGLAVLLSTWKTANSISQKGVSSLWLDEVFGPLGTAIVDRIFDSVIDIASDLGATSVYIISHRDLDSRLFDYSWKIDRIDGISSASIARSTDNGS